LGWSKMSLGEPRLKARASTKKRCVTILQQELTN
jgi:hypothetical protein